MKKPRKKYRDMDAFERWNFWAKWWLASFIFWLLSLVMCWIHHCGPFRPK